MKIIRPVKGMSTWKNELGFTCIAWHWSADPAKANDPNWAAREAASVPGGLASDHWRQEQEMDCHVVAGRPTYWAFKPSRNVIKQLPVPLETMRKWDIFLSADFGSTNATCWLFWAEDPKTKLLVVFDELYVDETVREEERAVLPIKSKIYRKLRSFFGVPDEDDFSFRDRIKYAVGDPSGKGYMLEYNSQPLPVHVSGDPPGAKIKLNDRYAGESRLNAYFAPRFKCCEAKGNPNGIYFTELGHCFVCGKEHRGYPRALILGEPDGPCTGAPKLIEQIPTIRKKIPTNPQLEHSDKDVNVEDHAVDAAKYGAMSRSPDAPMISNFDPERMKEEAPPSYAAERFAKHIDKLRKKAQDESDSADEVERETDDEMVRHAIVMNRLDLEESEDEDDEYSWNYGDEF
jgi:hypothetical protein